MEITKERKDKIEKMIVDATIDALEAGIIKESELQPIASFILSKIDAIKNPEELKAFLEELVGKWSFFHPVEQFLEGEDQKKEEQASVHTAEDMIKNGQIEEALKVLKATEGGGA